jgi:hypothetical protein
MLPAAPEREGRVCPVAKYAKAAAAVALLLAAFGLDYVSGNEVSASLFCVVGIGAAPGG